MDSYDFTQSSASTTWIINHGLNNSEPNVDCQTTFGGVFQKVIPLTIVATDANTVTVTFSVARTGKARVIA